MSKKGSLRFKTHLYVRNYHRDPPSTTSFDRCKYLITTGPALSSVHYLPNHSETDCRQSTASHCVSGRIRVNACRAILGVRIGMMIRTKQLPDTVGLCPSPSPSSIQINNNQITYLDRPFAMQRLGSTSRLNIYTRTKRRRIRSCRSTTGSRWHSSSHGHTRIMPW